MGTVAVIGSGIAGLAAAHDLAKSGRHRVIVLASEARLGGKLRTEPFHDVLLDSAADSFLARRPEARALCRELGLYHELVPPATGASYVWSRGALRRIPAGVVLGVPTDARALARSGILSTAGLARALAEPVWPGRALHGDTTVGAVIRRRFGAETAARLVDPLIGGINAGHTDRLSIDVVAPQLAAAARRGRSLTRALRNAPPSDPSLPVFLTLPGGMERLVDALVLAIKRGGGQVRTGEPVHTIEPGYRVHTPSAVLEVDGVVVATPAWAATGLLEQVSPAAARTIGAIEHSSVTLVTFAFPTAAVRRPLDASGFLVPRPEGLLLTACSWSSSKWSHLAGDDRVILRASAGRWGDDRAAALSDDELVGRLRAELGRTMAVGGEPLAVRVHRWPRAFPQYEPGHLDRMAGVIDELTRTAPGLAVAGAMLGGVGIPACIGTGREAAARVDAALGKERP